MNEFLFYLKHYSIYILWIIPTIIILKTLFSSSIKQNHSNWNTLIGNLNFSTLEFYKLLKEELNSHGLTGMKITNVRLKEGNMFSSKRLYLRVEWKEYQYDMCAAPIGKNDFFLSWWLLYKNSIGKIIVSKIPFIGGWIAQKMYPITYYNRDSASMFMSYAQSSVLKVIEEITSNKGVRALTDTEKKPVLNNVFTR